LQLAAVSQHINWIRYDTTV